MSVRGYPRMRSTAGHVGGDLCETAVVNGQIR